MEGNYIEDITPPKRERFQDYIVSQLKKIILQGKIKIGEHLPPERELAQKMDVSRAVIKQALISLESAGFIEIKTGPKGGAFVVENYYLPILNTFCDLLEWGNLELEHFVQCRQALEKFNIPLLLENIDDSHLERLMQINQKILEGLSDDCLLPKYNEKFHLALIEIGGNPMFMLWMQSLFLALDKFLPINHPADDFVVATFNRHEKIIQVLKEKDMDRCQELIMQDVSLTGYLR